MTLIGENFPPPTGGMVKAVAPWLLAPNQAEVLIDTDIDNDGSLARRGPFVATYTLPRFAGTLGGFSGGIAYGGLGTTKKYLSLSGNLIHVTSDFVSYTTLQSATTEIGIRFWTAEDTGNGVIIITGHPYNPSVDKPLTFTWAGGSLSTAVLSLGYQSKAGTIAVTGTAVTGVGTSFTTELSVGDYLYTSVNSNFIGIVKSITNNTSLTLYDSCYAGTVGAGTAYKANSTGYINPRFSGGTLTTRTTQSTAIGNNTNLSALPTSTGSQVPIMVRKNSPSVSGTAASSDFAGFTQYDPATDNPVTISFRTAGTTTLTNALVNADNAYWFGYRLGFGQATDFLYKMATLYSGRWWYAGSYEENKTEVPLYYSGLDHYEDIDTSSKGTWFNVKASSANPIIRIVGTRNALVIFNRNTVHAVFGDSPATFRYEQIDVEAPIGPGAVTKFRDGVAWVGVNGIYFFNGSSIENLTAQSFSDSFNTLHDYPNTRLEAGTALATARMTDATLTPMQNYLLFSLNNAQATDYRKAFTVPAARTAFKSDAGNVPEYTPPGMALLVNTQTKSAVLWSNARIVNSVNIDSKQFLMYLGTTNDVALTGSTNPQFYLCPVNTVLSPNPNVDQSSDTAFAHGVNMGWRNPFVTPVANSLDLLCYTSTGTSDMYFSMGTPNMGVWKPDEYTSKLTALDGTAMLGSVVAPGTYAWPYFTGTTIDAMFDVSSFTPLTGSDGSIMSYFMFRATQKTTEQLLVRLTSLTGLRVTFSGANVVVDTVSFPTATSWTPSFVANKYTGSSGSGDLYLLFGCTHSGNPAFRYTGVNTSQVAWLVGPSALPGGTPYVLTRGFSKPGVRSWIRKLRTYYGGDMITDVHLVTDQDTPRATLSGWIDVSLPATTAGSTSHSAIRMGRTVEVWQYALSPRSLTNWFKMYNFTNYFKTLRGGRP